ncbi:MAG: hypothetical protein ACM34L_13295 [Gemmatimonas sp.]|nr:hypothetical protein [Gemmatimonadaceae bacterium]
MSAAPAVSAPGVARISPSRTRAIRPATVVVWGTWAIMVLIALACIARYGRNIPLAEDWLMVPPMTGHEPHLASWLWAQNNEHRSPLSRLVLLGVLALTHDFRAGMVLNVASLSALAAGMILTARYLRDGETRASDAFFPIALLHLGDWENLVWAWQFQFVSSAVLICALMLAIARQRGTPTLRQAVVAAASLVLLPLTGASGLVFALALAPWAAWAGLAQRRSARAGKMSSASGTLLLSSAIVAPILVAVYFIGYVTPWWNPPNPGRLQSLKTTLRFLALAWGAAVRNAWTLSIIATVALLAVTLLLLVRALVDSAGSERQRAFGLLSFAGGCAVLALAIGWGRAATDMVSGMPMRYVLFAVPALCATYFIWELYAPLTPRRWVQAALCLVMVVLLPWNTREGFGLPGRYDLGWRGWYVTGMNAVEQDIEGGVPRLEMARRHREFLMHWDEAKLAAGMRMLHDARIGPFGSLRDDR